MKKKTVCLKPGRSRGKLYLEKAISLYKIISALADARGNPEGLRKVLLY